MSPDQLPILAVIAGQLVLWIRNSSTIDALERRIASLEERIGGDSK